MCRCWFFKDWNPRILHHRAMASHRILFAGDDCGLPKLLKAELEPLDCAVVRCPDERQARIFIRSDIKYSLLLFEEELSAAAELERFARPPAHRATPPVVVYKKSDGLKSLVKTVRRLLGG